MWNEKLECKFSMSGNRYVSTRIEDASVVLKFKALTEKTLSKFDSSLTPILKSLSDSNIKALEYDVSKLKRVLLDVDGQKLFGGKFNKFTGVENGSKQKI